MKFIVIKVGGEVLDNPHRARLCVEECVALSRSDTYHPIIVHGGGKQISEMSAHFHIQPVFENGLRMTSATEMRVVEMVLAGSVNSLLVRALHDGGASAVGVSGVSAALLTAITADHTARSKTAAASPSKAEDNFTALAARCNPQLLFDLCAQYVPVVAPIGSTNGVTYNINADSAAVAIAEAVSAQMLLFITDVPGVLDESGTRIQRLDYDHYRHLISGNVITGGMRAKLAACFDRDGNGIKKISIGMLQAAGDMLLLIDQKRGTAI